MTALPCKLLFLATSLIPLAALAQTTPPPAQPAVPIPAPQPTPQQATEPAQQPTGGAQQAPQNPTNQAAHADLDSNPPADDAPTAADAKAAVKRDTDSLTAAKQHEKAEAALVKTIAADPRHDSAKLRTAQSDHATAAAAVVDAQTELNNSQAVFDTAKQNAAAGVKCDTSATANLCEYINFVGGSLFSANGNNYSQASLFLAMNFDRTVKIPTPHGVGWNTFFQARLTAIPVNSTQTTQTVPASGSTTTATSTASFLAAQKAVQFGAGTYIPVRFHDSGTWAAYWAPIARFGFSTPAGAPTGSSTSSNTNGSTTIVTTTTLGSTAANNGQLYNFWTAGLRVASATVNNANALTTQHYFDITLGKYSNLQSLLCAAPTPPSTASTCSPITITSESRATLLRLAFEGYIEVPTGTDSTSLILGISANTGPGNLNRKKYIDTNNRAPEDIEFFIGAKFDASKLIPTIFNK